MLLDAVTITILVLLVYSSIYAKIFQGIIVTFPAVPPITVMPPRALVSLDTSQSRAFTKTIHARDIVPVLWHHTCRAFTHVFAFYVFWSKWGLLPIGFVFDITCSVYDLDLLHLLCSWYCLDWPCSDLSLFVTLSLHNALDLFMTIIIFHVVVESPAGFSTRQQWHDF